MRTLKARMFYEPNDIGVLEQYLMLEESYIDEDGFMKKIIKPENIGVIRDFIYMDMPVMYHRLSPLTMEKLKKNNFNCEVEVENNDKLKKINNLVVMVIK